MRDLETYNRNDLDIFYTYYAIPFNLEKREKLKQLARLIYNEYHLNSSNMRLNCSNDIDIFTMEEWDETNPAEIKIGFLQKDNKLYTECYSINTLFEWIHNTENYFTNWVQKDPERPMDKEGYGGEPGNRIILSTPLKNYVVGFYKLQRNVRRSIPYYNYIAIPIETNYRIGNLSGTFGQGQKHGQAPGETIYYLVYVKDGEFTEEKLEELKNKKYTIQDYPSYKKDMEYLEFLVEDSY